MRVPVTAAGAAVVLFVVGAGALWWVGLAFDTVPIRWDPSIGNSCRAVDPGTMDDLRRAAAVPLVLLVLSSAGLSVIAGLTAERDLSGVGAARPVQVSVAGSAVVGGGLVWLSYAIGDVFSVMGLLVAAGVVVLLVVGILWGARGVAGSWAFLGRPFWLAVLQLLVVPAVVMATTYTDEIPIC